RRAPVPGARRTAFKQELLAKLRAQPGVEGAGEGSILPLSGGSSTKTGWGDGMGGSPKVEAQFNQVRSGDLKAMGMPLLAGRDFDRRDSTAAPRVGIVNQSFARRLGLGENPVGRRFRRESTPTEREITVEIIGLARDTKQITLREEFLPAAFL